MTNGNCAIMDAIGRILTLRAQSAGMTWGKDAEAIKVNSIALCEAQARFDKPREYPFDINGFYRGMEDFAGLWALGEIDRFHFLWSAIDQIAREAADQHSPPMFIHNSFGFAHRFGDDGTEALLAVLRGSAPTLCQQWRRAETTDDDDRPIFAPVGTEDSRFDEAWLVECGEDDEHATQITFMDLDEDEFGSLVELVKKKWDAAKRAFMAAPSSQAPE
jgi:hypothetical protein